MMWKQASDTEQDFIECNAERDQVCLMFARPGANSRSYKQHFYDTGDDNE